MADEQQWLTPAQVAKRLGGGDGDVTEDDVTDETAAAVAYVRDRRPDLFVDLEEGAQVQVPADVILGAKMLASRLYARRGSALGLVNYTEFAASVVRQDPDIARLIGVGLHEPPMVG